MINHFDFNNFIKDFANCCAKVQKKSFVKNSIITTYIQKRNQLCILLSGSADLIRYNLSGNKTIVEHFTAQDIFGEIFYMVTMNNELSVVAREDCEVLFFHYDDIYRKCNNRCKFHDILAANLPELILNKITDLNLRIELLTKRTIREKILFYFNSLSSMNFSKTFSMPFSLTDLADYLSVDRSAMMREMKYLKEEGFISKNKNKITLLY